MSIKTYRRYGDCYSPTALAGKQHLPSSSCSKSNPAQGAVCCSAYSRSSRQSTPSKTQLRGLLQQRCWTMPSICQRRWRRKRLAFVCATRGRNRVKSIVSHVLEHDQYACLSGDLSREHSRMGSRATGPPSRDAIVVSLLLRSSAVLREARQMWSLVLCSPLGKSSLTGYARLVLTHCCRHSGARKSLAACPWQPEPTALHRRMKQSRRRERKPMSGRRGKSSSFAKSR